MIPTNHNDVELTPTGRPKQDWYPVRIAKFLSEHVLSKHVVNFYKAIGEMVVGEIVRDLNMAANKAEVEGRPIEAHNLRLAAGYVTTEHKLHKYPQKVKFK